MRERQQLESQIGAVERMERELDDQTGLIELGEAEGDADVVAEAEEALRGLHAEAERRAGRDDAVRRGGRQSTASSKSTPAPAAPRARTGRRCCMRMYTRWAEASGYKVEVLEVHDGEEAGIKSATLQVERTQRLWLAEDRIRRAPPGAHLALRQPGAAAHLVRQRVGLSGGRRLHRDRHQRRRRAHRHLPLPPAPAASTSTPPTRPSA